MAGRSGAALIEMELREAAQRIDPRALAEGVRKRAKPGEDALAAALDALGEADAKPRIERLDGEVLAHFDLLSADAGASVQKFDVTELCAADGYSVEVHICAPCKLNAPMQVACFSFFLE